MTSDSLTGQLEDYALSRGVDLIGITSARPFVLRGGRRSTTDPKTLLPDARSIIVSSFYMNEAVDSPSVDKDNPRGRFSHAYSVRAYTPMENHHVEVIGGFLGSRGYKAVFNKDYLIPDKMAAARAGLGRYGKNALIVTKEHGSLVMFVTLITNAPLQYRESGIYTSDCGTCEICVKSCPTRAIREPFKVNRELCITAWLWGAPAPMSLRERQENRLFGCGECVRACPRNEGLISREEYPVKVEEVSAAPELIPLVTGDEQYYRKAVASFPLRAGIDAIRGNAIIALGNTGVEAAIDPLGQALAHPKPQIRAYSAWSLGRIGGARARRILKKALQDERDRQVSREIRQALNESGRARDSHE